MPVPHNPRWRPATPDPLSGGPATRPGPRLTGLYEKGIKISDERMEALTLNKDDFHGEWNYTVRPSSSQENSVKRMV
ncbi:MAG: hypothetical protein M0Z41_08840 [Peptococcaceae bacterium]|nr:hypothetical protein [Peptococcaceae bacterium]